MKTKTKIFCNGLLRAVMLMMVMGWSIAALADDNPTAVSEKLIYDTDFTDLENIDRTTATDKVVSLKTNFTNEDLTFTLNGVGTDPVGYNSKFSAYTGYLIIAKYAADGSQEYSKAMPSAVTSPLSSLTRIELTQTATGGKRGLKVSVKGDGDTDWVTLHNQAISSGSGQKLILDVNRTNCQIKFEQETNNAEAEKQNAYIVDLKLYGNVPNREFKDFKINFRTKPYTIVKPADGLLDGVKLISGSYISATHGYRDAKLSVAVSGPVKFYIGTCINTNGATVSVNDGEPIAIDTKSSTCDGKDTYTKYVTYVYNSKESAVLTFDLGNYCPYIIAEEAEKTNRLEFEAPEGVKGQYPTTIRCDKDDKVTLPDGRLFSVDGYTFEEWTDGTNDYQPGQEATFTNEVTHIKPKMRKNTIELYESNKETTVKWAFDHTDAPAINIFSSNVQKTVSYTEPTIIFVDEKTQEIQNIPLLVNVSTGKLDNTDSRVNALGGGEKGALVWDGTTFTMPAISGMQVTVHASGKVDDQNNNATTIFGTGDNDAKISLIDVNGDSLAVEDGILTDDGRTITFHYNGDAKEITMKMIKAGAVAVEKTGFIKDITAIYPVLPSVEYTKAITNADTKNFPYETAERAGDVTFGLADDSDKSSHGNTGTRFKVGDVIKFNAVKTEYGNANYGYDFVEFREGETAISKEAEFTYTVKAGKNVITAVYTRKPMYKLVLKTADSTKGTIRLSPKFDNFYHETTNKKGNALTAESWYTAGTQVTVNGNPLNDYVLDYWAAGEDTLSTDNPYTFNMESKDITITANFELGKVGTVIFRIDKGTVNGASDATHGAYSVTPEALRKVRSFTIPSNYTFYKNQDENGYGSTLEYWQEESTGTKYEIGETYSFKNENETLTLVPVFSQNPATFENRLNNTVLHYDFAREVHTYDDPMLNEKRNVCAQPVAFGNNEKPFWTAKAFVEVIEDGKEQSHRRDVALWCDTGSKGYIRNTDLTEWCAFGPGTTFWVPSGVGTKISMLTYSKITTTTFDGVVPTIDEERTKIERQNAGTDKLYVYSYTTNNYDSRVKIVIGDDYSYYHWIELNILAANMVHLHASVDDNSRGKITKVESTSGREVENLEDGAHAFHQGDRVRMTVERDFGYDIDRIVLEGETPDEAPITLLTTKSDGSVDMVLDEDLKTIRNYKADANGVYGIESGEGKSVFMVKKIEPTDDEKRNGEHTRYEIEFDITRHRTLKVLFKEKKTYYITYNAGELASGAPPEAVWAEAGDEFTITENRTLYYEGNTLDHWVDEAGNQYDIGSTHNAPANDLRLFPVFRPNDFNILDLTEDATATWYFAKNDGAPTIAYEGTNGFLVTQLTNEKNEKIDIKIDLKAYINENTKGKFNNTNTDHPERIQINSNSVIEFTATPKCVASLQASGKDDGGKKVKIEGKEVKTDKNTLIASKECTAKTSTLKVEFIDGPYCKSFSVTYKPQTAKKATISSLTCGKTTYDAAEIKKQMDENEQITFKVSPWDDPNEEMPTVTGTATEKGSVSVTNATLETKKCVATVCTASGIVVETYPIVFEFVTPPEGNDPVFQKIAVNNVESSKTENVFDDVAQSGVIKVSFNRTMQATTFTIPELNITVSSESGRELVFKYWDLPKGGTLKFEITPDLNIFKDIYGKTCQQPLSLTLNITKKEDQYAHHKFNFVVGPDGTMDDAIKAANEYEKGDNDRYYIFVPDGEYQLTGNELVSGLGNRLNGMTQITKSHISLIGQSKNGVTIWNEPETGGISYSGTIHLQKNTTDFYAQDLTLENRLDYWTMVSAEEPTWGVAFWDQGNKSILKNVGLKSYQDTYYSNNASADSRAYFETCDIAGVVDFLCGDGNIWLEKCNIILRDRSSNNIAATGQGEIQKWGYVFNNCTINPETENPFSLKDYNWTLARPWNHSPACTFLNTKMNILPTLAGWGKMGTDMVVRFHEYRSVDANGTLISLGTRSLTPCAPGPGSDDCILTEAQANEYTLHNVVGGSDAFEPNELCRQIDAKSGTEADQDENHEAWDDQIELDDDNLIWQAYDPALCYFVFKLDNQGKWIYQTNTIDNSVNLVDYGSGYYCVRAANQRGGLGAATEMIHFELQDPYELEIKQTGNLTVDGVPYGWSTICLPYNARVPEDAMVYAATAHDQKTADKKIIDFVMTLTPVSVIDSLKGYVVHGPAGIHYFNPTSRSCDKPTILEGNATVKAISAVNKSCYVLANKAWGLGFYKFSGSTLAANRAWLPQSMVDDKLDEVLSTGTRAIRFAFDTSNIPYTTFKEGINDGYIYTIGGQRIATMPKRGIFIQRGKGKILRK